MPSCVWVLSSVAPPHTLILSPDRFQAALPASRSKAVCRASSAFSRPRPLSRPLSVLARKWGIKAGKQRCQPWKWPTCSPNCRGRMTMGTRRKARELAVQLLYQQDLAKEDPEEGMRLFWDYFPVEMEAREFCTQLVLGTLDRLTVIDELLSEASENWSLNRMSVVDRNILRLATY